MAANTETTSHAEALKSSAIVGGSSAIVLLIRMIRIKALALLLGPAGIGLEAIFDSITNLARTAADLGISSSGVRQIAAAAGTGDEKTIARTVVTVRRVCVLLGLAGATGLFIFREAVSLVAFGDATHASGIGVLSVALFFGCVMGGQMALLQGMRHIADLARVNVLGALVGTVFSIPVVYLMGQRGIPAYLAIVAGVGLLMSWLYARRISIQREEVSLRDITQEARGLLKLGVAFASSALMTVGALFLIRVLVVREEGVAGAGQFQAASALSMVYIGFVLQAMGTDFYPRLAAVSEDNNRCNRLVNEQAEISLLLGIPGILMTIALAPWILMICYSSKFEVAAQVLCWQAAGMLLRIGSWPMGFIVMAKGRSAIFFLTELLAHTFYLGLAWIGLKLYHLPGAGMAFVGLYLFHWCMMYGVVRRMTGFSWSAMNRKLALAGLFATAITVGTRLGLSEPWATAIGSALAIGIGSYCAITLASFIGQEKLERLLGKFGLAFCVPKLLWLRGSPARIAVE